MVCGTMYRVKKEEILFLGEIWLLPRNFLTRVRLLYLLSKISNKFQLLLCFQSRALGVLEMPFFLPWNRHPHRGGQVAREARLWVAVRINKYKNSAIILLITLPPILPWSIPHQILPHFDVKNISLAQKLTKWHICMSTWPPILAQCVLVRMENLPS